jgi:glycosyltransferase involved in cell wall biosynthesis
MKKTINKKVSLSAILIVKDEEAKIKDCLESVAWVDEIIIVDTGSKDATKLIAKKYTTKIYDISGGSYDSWRNYGLKKANGIWIFYIDADERVSDALRSEITQLIKSTNSKYNAYAIPRKNIILGREMIHGGWWPDYVKRLYKRKDLKYWKGKLHEEPVFDGEIGHLINPLIHKKHDKLFEMTNKTNSWSEIEAEMLFESGHPKMVWWRFVRIMLSELWDRLVVKKGFLDGVEGIIYSIYQMWSRFITYAKLWELQMKKDFSKIDNINETEMER